MLQVYYAFIVTGFAALGYLMLFHKHQTNKRDW